jgi:RNA polymerase sigma-70 factor (ECF subfamily)
MICDPCRKEYGDMATDAQLETAYTREIEKAFLENHEMVYRTAYRITGNASDAEDVLQTLFLRLVRREWTPSPEYGWPAYLTRSAINIALDVVRSRTRQKPLDDEEFALPSNRPDAHREYSATQLREALSTALAELSPAAAEMFVLRYIEGRAVREIAGMLNTSSGVVAVTLFRTRSRLQKSIRHFLGAS